MSEAGYEQDVLGKAHWLVVCFLGFHLAVFLSRQSCSSLRKYFDARGGQRVLATIDTNTGLVTTIGPFSAATSMTGITYVSSMNAVFGIASDPNDSALPSSFYRIDLGTGAPTLIGNTGIPLMWSLQFDPISNQLFSTTVARPGGDPSLYTIDPFTGIPTLVGSLGLPAGVNATRDLAFDIATNKMYLATEGVSDAGQDFNGLHVIDTGTGLASFLGLFKGGGPPTTLNNLRAMAFDVTASQLLGVQADDPDQLVVINTATGEATAFQNLSIGSQNSSHVLSLAFVPRSVISVPEPSTLAIFAIGLAGLGFFGWRRKRHDKAWAASA